MARQRPEPGVEYAAAPTAEYAAAGARAAARSLAAFLGVTESRAAALLDDPVEYAAEIRRHQADPGAAMARLRRRHAGPAVAP